jgi:TPR repeat protein
MKVTTRTFWFLAGAVAPSLTLALPVLAGATEGISLESTQRTAAKGNAQAIYDLGKRYARGDGVPQDYGQAAEYLR